jgi:hypothetical protein
MTLLSAYGFPSAKPPLYSLTLSLGTGPNSAPPNG